MNFKHFISRIYLQSVEFVRATSKTNFNSCKLMQTQYRRLVFFYHYSVLNSNLIRA